MVEVVVFAIAIFLFVYLLILQPHKIKGSSMVPNFLDGEYLLTEKISYRLRTPKRGEVIVFEAPGAKSDEFIKRIIALPGEEISLKGGKVYINGRELKEDYLPPNLVTLGGEFLKEGESKIVPQDSYFVMGDNRFASSDSRTWGFVPRSAITGRVWIIYWPFSKAGLVTEASYSP